MFQSMKGMCGTPEKTVLGRRIQRRDGGDGVGWGLVVVRITAVRALAPVKIFFPRNNLFESSIYIDLHSELYITIISHNA